MTKDWSKELRKEMAEDGRMLSLISFVQGFLAEQEKEFKITLNSGRKMYELGRREGISESQEFEYEKVKKEVRKETLQEARKRILFAFSQMSENLVRRKDGKAVEDILKQLEGLENETN